MKEMKNFTNNFFDHFFQFFVPLNLSLSDCPLVKFSHFTIYPKKKIFIKYFQLNVMACGLKCTAAVLYLLFILPKRYIKRANSKIDISFFFILCNSLPFGNKAITLRLNTRCFHSVKCFEIISSFSFGIQLQLSAWKKRKLL